MPEKQRVVVHIMNREYAIIGAESADYVRWLAGMVDQRMRQISLGADASLDRIAVLAALNLADELYKLQEQSAKERQELHELRRALEKSSQAAPAPAGDKGGPSQRHPGGNNGNRNGASKGKPRG